MKHITICSFFLGWAYDLKTVSEEMIRRRAARTGDGTNDYSNCIKPGHIRKEDLNAHVHEDLVWGWDDKDMSDRDKCEALIINKEK